MKKDDLGLPALHNKKNLILYLWGIFCETKSIDFTKSMKCNKIDYGSCLWDFTLKASLTSILAEANAHSADWLMSVFVNELARPMYAVNKVRACSSPEQVWQILKYFTKSKCAPKTGNNLASPSSQMNKNVKTHSYMSQITRNHITRQCYR